MLDKLKPPKAILEKLEHLFMVENYYTKQSTQPSSPLSPPLAVKAVHDFPSAMVSVPSKTVVSSVLSLSSDPIQKTDRSGRAFLVRHHPTEPTGS